MDLISLMFVFLGVILLIGTSACLVIDIFKRKK